MATPMKQFLTVLCLFSPAALACDTPQLQLTGTASVKTCHAQSWPDCVYSGKALYDYMEAVPDSIRIN